MKKELAVALYKEMAKNENIILVTADLGFKLWDQIRDDMPKQFINTGSSEQTAMGICVGLALSGKIPVFYSITPFALFRPAETIRIYLNHEQVPVKIVGAGRDDDYRHDGYSHHAYDTKEILNIWPNIQTYFPPQPENVEECVRYMLYNDKPSFLSIRK